MATATWNSWFDDVLPHVPGCPQNVAEYAIKRAVIDFCVSSLYLWEWRPYQPVAAGAAAIIPSLPVDTELAGILGMKLEGHTLDPKAPAELDLIYPDWKTKQGTPLFYTQERDDVFWIVPALTVPTTQLRIALSYKPSETAGTVDDVIFKQWREDIASGALARLMGGNKKPYSNYDLAMAHSNRFDGAIRIAKMQASRSFSGDAAIRTKPVFF